MGPEGRRGEGGFGGCHRVFSLLSAPDAWGTKKEKKKKKKKEKKGANEGGKGRVPNMEKGLRFASETWEKKKKEREEGKIRRGRRSGGVFYRLYPRKRCKNSLQKKEKRSVNTQESHPPILFSTRHSAAMTLSVFRPKEKEKKKKKKQKNSEKKKRKKKRASSQLCFLLQRFPRPVLRGTTRGKKGGEKRNRGKLPKGKK